MGLFSDVRLYFDADVDEGVAVVILVIENPRLKEVAFEGNKAVKDKSLKKEIGFNGLIFTDAMNMHGVTKYF